MTLISNCGERSPHSRRSDRFPRPPGRAWVSRWACRVSRPTGTRTDDPPGDGGVVAGGGGASARLSALFAR